MTWLLDANVLIALTVEDHQHYQPARAWFARSVESFASCPITQGALIRAQLRGGATAAEAVGLVDSLVGDSRHEFWPDDLPYSGISWAGVIGHRQVTDAYLAELARHHGGRLATFDRALAGAHSDVCELVTTGSNV